MDRRRCHDTMWLVFGFLTYPCVAHHTIPAWTASWGNFCKHFGKQDFCWNLHFECNERLLFKHCWCEGRLLFKHFGCKARLLFNHFGCKARLSFKHLWCKAKLLFKHLEYKARLLCKHFGRALTKGQHRPEASKKKKHKVFFYSGIPLRSRCFIRKWVNPWYIVCKSHLNILTSING